MAGTALTLIFQSDQILDSPQIKNKIVLKTLVTDMALNLTFTVPAGANRNVNFPDPGADDSVIYANLAQTLANKTLDVTTTIPDQPQYAHLTGQVGGQVLNGGTNNSEQLTLRSTTAGTKGGIVIDVDDILIGSTHNAIFSGGGEPRGLPATPATNFSATSKNYVDAQVASATSGATTWREIILAQAQLDTPHRAVAQGVVFYLTSVPNNGDFITIADGVNTETYTYAGVDAPFSPTPGATASDAMDHLATHINADSGFWKAFVSITLQALNTKVVVIYRKVPSTPVNDRVFGNFTAGGPHIVNYGAQADYRSSATIVLPGPLDPGVANFGFSRITAGLTPDEAHIARSEAAIYIYNDDLGVWQPSAGSVGTATSGLGGGVLGISTFDENFGLTIPGGGVVRVKSDGTSITFNGSGQLQVVTGTSGAGGATKGKFSADENFALTAVAGVLRVKPDTTSVILNGTGQLQAPTRALLSDGVFGNFTGTVTANLDYPNIGGGEYISLYDMSSVSASGRADVAFSGMLFAPETQITQISVPLRGTGPTPKYHILVYVEGTVGTVFDSGLIAAPGVLTVVNISGGSLSAQPTGTKRFIVVAQAFINNGDALLVGCPNVIQQ